jgi:hypothetical protein
LRKPALQLIPDSCCVEHFCASSLTAVCCVYMQNRRTDDPNEEDRSSSYSIKPELRGPTEQPGTYKAYNWDTTSYRTSPRCLLSCLLSYRTNVQPKLHLKYRCHADRSVKCSKALKFISLLRRVFHSGQGRHAAGKQDDRCRGRTEHHTDNSVRPCSRFL